MDYKEVKDLVASILTVLSGLKLIFDYYKGFLKLKKSLIENASLREKVFGITYLILSIFFGIAVPVYALYSAWSFPNWIVVIIKLIAVSALLGTIGSLLMILVIWYKLKDIKFPDSDLKKHP